MRHKLISVLTVLLGTAVLTGGTVGVASAATPAKKHQAKKQKNKKRQAANSAADATEAGATGQRSGPTALTGDAKTQAEAAALAAVPGGTVLRSFAAKEGNPKGAAYVVVVQKDDESKVDVLEDASFGVIEVVAAKGCKGRGRGNGGRGGHERPAPLAGDVKTQAEAAALAAVPEGTVKASHAARPGDESGAVYAVHVSKADGSEVVVLEDAAYAVLKVVDRPARHEGRGPRGPRGDF